MADDEHQRVTPNSQIRLSRSFFDRPAPEVARALLGCTLVRKKGNALTSVRIAETEAYTQDDPASHSASGPTARNASMFAAAGTLYVYRIYGMHFCANVSTGAEGEGSAVLIRAGEPLVGETTMRRRRPGVDRDLLCRGPGRLAQALAIDLRLDGVDLTSGQRHAWIEPGPPGSAGDARASQRIGVRRGVETLWRFTREPEAWASGP